MLGILVGDLVICRACFGRVWIVEVKPPILDGTLALAGY